MEHRRDPRTTLLTQVAATFLFVACTVLLLAGGWGASAEVGWLAALVLGLLALACAVVAYHQLTAAGKQVSAEPTVDGRHEVLVVDARQTGNGSVNACRDLIARPDTRVVVVVSPGEEDLLRETVAAGAMGYLMRPLGPADLTHATAAGAWRGAAISDSSQRAAARQHAEAAFAGLTQQELRVLLLIAEGKTNREIAEAMYLGDGTVRNYVSNILSKLSLANRAEAAAYAVQHGLRDYLSSPNSSRTV